MKLKHRVPKQRPAMALLATISPIVIFQFLFQLILLIINVFGPGIPVLPVL